MFQEVVMVRDNPRSHSSIRIVAITQHDILCYCRIETFTLSRLNSSPHYVFPDFPTSQMFARRVIDC